MKNCAVLALYKANCNSHGLTEGKFYHDAVKGRELQRYLDDMNIVLESLNKSIYKKILARIETSSLCRTDDEANKLVEYAKKNISDSKDRIRLITCMHAEIDFTREIEFGGYTSDMEEELIKKLQESGYKPVSACMEIEDTKNTLSAFIKRDSELFKNEIAKESEKIYYNKWKYSLKFL